MPEKETPAAILLAAGVKMSDWCLSGICLLATGANKLGSMKAVKLHIPIS
jgi:hypothetical protein